MGRKWKEMGILALIMKLASIKETPIFHFTGYLESAVY